MEEERRGEKEGVVIKFKFQRRSSSNIDSQLQFRILQSKTQNSYSLFSDII